MTSDVTRLPLAGPFKMSVNTGLHSENVQCILETIQDHNMKYSVLWVNYGSFTAQSFDKFEITTLTKR